VTLQVSHPTAAELLAEQVEHGQDLLQRARIIGEPSDYTAWKVTRERWVVLAAEALGQIYDGSAEADEFKDAASFPAGDGKWQVDFERDLDCVRSGIDLLVSLQDRVETELDPADASEPGHESLVGSELARASDASAELEQQMAAASRLSSPGTNSDGLGPGDMGRVFLVHGRSDRWKQAVVHVLEHAGSHPVVVLGGGPNGDGTVLEQFGQPGSGSSFAVVLLTADDVGAPHVDSDQEPYFSTRACQSVVFEMGFLVAALTPQCVCVLYEDGVELPCDVEGISYVRLDLAGAWQLQLLLKLRAAGFNYDLNRLAPV
jgi:predicted nucleotide-binding protein